MIYNQIVTWTAFAILAMFSSSILCSTSENVMNILLFPLPKPKFCVEQMAEDFLGGCSRVTGGGEENNFESISNFPSG